VGEGKRDSLFQEKKETTLMIPRLRPLSLAILVEWKWRR